MNKHISLKEAKAYGIEPLFEEMPNKEKRFRLLAKDGSSYCRTEASDKGAWQNSHFHKQMTELYVVQSGSILFAVLERDTFVIKELIPGDTITVSPYCPHNLYLHPDAVIHTIKYGDATPTAEPDWYPSPELDHYIGKRS